MRQLKFIIIFLFMFINCGKNNQEITQFRLPEFTIYGALKISDDLIGIYTSCNYWEFKKIIGNNLTEAKEISLTEFPLIQPGLYKNKLMGIFKKGNNEFFCLKFENNKWEEIKIDFPSLFRVEHSFQIY